MSWAAIGSAAATVVGGAIFGDKGGGGGGGVSAKTQGGTNEVAFNPVGLEALEVSPFEYMQQEFDQEQAQNMQYGGPLYRGKGGDIAEDIFSQGIKDMMPQGILGVLLSSYFLDHENDNEEESIVPGLDAGGGIGDLFDPEILGEFDPSVAGAEVLSYSEAGQPNTQASASESTTSQFSPEELATSLGTQNTKDMFKQLGTDFALEDLLPLLGKRLKQEKTGKSSVKGRGNIVPEAGGGGRANRQQRQKTVSQTITPFQYRAMQGGGALNRQMFMQNQMPNGGDIRGPGGPKEDLIPVMASNGEYMLSKAAVDQAGGGNHSKGIANLEQFNNRGNRRYG